jgi:ribosome-binding ATPase YchF (GTP1/OBG family)
MKIGLIGYQGSGKSTLFEWLTGVKPDFAAVQSGQSAMAPVPEQRVEPLCQIYHPKKVTLASLEIVDTPGLSRTHEGNAARLGLIREAGCLVLVVAAFDGRDPKQDLTSFQEDFMLADMAILQGRIDRLRESVKKAKPTREQELAELHALEPMLATLERGQSLLGYKMDDEQAKSVRSFGLLTQKPTIVVVNLADDDDQPQRFDETWSGGVPVLGIRLGLELELARLEPAEREEMIRDLGLSTTPRDQVIRRLMDVSGQFLYFTAGDKEVRTWMLHKGGTALEAAANIHTDLARGFIRAETMRCEDLIRLGSEREIKAHNLLRSEPKDYVVQEGDILHIRFSV